jgi:hypothetical protein
MAQSSIVGAGRKTPLDQLIGRLRGRQMPSSAKPPFFGAALSAARDCAVSFLRPPGMRFGLNRLSPLEQSRAHKS